MGVKPMGDVPIKGRLRITRYASAFIFHPSIRSAKSPSVPRQSALL
jgi:hypothetical protein